MDDSLVLDLSAGERLTYSHETGEFTWIAGRARGKIAGTTDSYGYRQIRVNGRTVLAHRLVWLLVTGEWPEIEIDHINGDRSDNRFSNLRLATRAQNMRNMKSKTGFKGTSFHRKSGRWNARIRVNNHRYFLGYFDTREEAHEAYKAAACEYHAEFARFS